MQDTRGSRCVSQRCWRVGMYGGSTRPRTALSWNEKNYKNGVLKSSFELESEVGLNGKGPQWLTCPQLLNIEREASRQICWLGTPRERCERACCGSRRLVLVVDSQRLEVSIVWVVGGAASVCNDQVAMIKLSAGSCCWMKASLPPNPEAHSCSPCLKLRC